MFGTVPYIPGSTPKKTEPLARYLPPVPEGVVSIWLKQHIPQGSWVLDPYGASPRLAIEVARAGYRLLVTANNPIVRFLLEMESAPPKASFLRAVLAELAASFKGEERLELLIRSLYNTICARCGQIVSADAFLWEHDASAPYSRIYTCPACGDSGEHPCIPYDAERAVYFASSGIHRARALERVTVSDDHDRIHAEQAIAVYLPRAVYAIITLVNKLEGLHISVQDHKYLAALLLNAFDLANTMWKVPSERERRRQLTIPPHFRENNIWLALEQGIDLWSDVDTANYSPLTVTFWPDQPPSNGGICIFEGRLISLVESLKEIEISSVCTALPRPNQAFWTLSALWAGWLWGREAVGSFKSVLHRQRYDWGWHTSALYSVLYHLLPILHPSTLIFGLIGEVEPGFIASALVAADNAGFGFESISIRAEEGQAQVIWKCKSDTPAINVHSSLCDIAILSAKNYLENIGEPTTYLNTMAAAFAGISKMHALYMTHQIQTKDNELDKSTKREEISGQTESTPSSDYSRVFNAAREALTYRAGFIRLTSQDQMAEEVAEKKSQTFQDTLFRLDEETSVVEKIPPDNLTAKPIEVERTTEKDRTTRSSDISESIMIWLRETSQVNHFPLSDRYEIALVNYLLKHPGCTYEEIDAALCDSFPGLTTPDTEFIRVCLDSYGEQVSPESKKWHIHPQDTPSQRHTDLETTQADITQIADRLGLKWSIQTEDRTKPTVRWMDKTGTFEYWFFPIVSALISEVVLYSEQPPSQGYIVLPGSRANLVIYKLSRDPRLSKIFNPSSGKWRFLKFRHLRSLVENPLLNRENLDPLLGLDPLTYSTSQLRLI